MKRLVFLNLCLSTSICGSSSAFAAPPNVTYLYPAGAQRGTTAEVAAAGTFDKWPVKVWVGGKGVTVEPGKDKGKLTVTVAEDAVPGVYWLRAYNDDGASGLRPFIVGLLPEVREKEPNDEFKKPQVINGSSVVVNGRLEKPGDVDCFAVALKKGQTLVASVEAHHTLRSPMDGVLQVLSADGFVLDQNNDFHGLDPQLAFTAPKDGTYIARVFAFPATPDSAIRFAGAETFVYRLTLTTGPFADYPAPLAVAAPVEPERVELRGWNIPPGLKAFRIAYHPEQGTHATAFHADAANPVRLRIEPHTAYADPLPPDHRLKPPFSASGQIQQPGGEVAYPIAGRKGEALSVQLESRSLGLAVNPVVRVLDKEKKQLARAEPAKVSGDTTLSFTPPADDTYTIAVSDLYSGGGPRHAFLLRVLTPEPDYDLVLATDRFTVPPGKSTDIPVRVNRRNGFARSVEVTAEGLPEGVTLEVKPPAKKADPNTITATLKAEKAGVSGPFRLVGGVKGEPKFARTARAPLPEFDETTADLWVTVTDKPAAQPPPKKKK